ncbi:MAG: aminotransferase-like domain-containing protein [Chloroflexota bacterium]
MTFDWSAQLMRGAQKPLGSEALGDAFRFRSGEEAPVSFVIGAPDPSFFPSREIGQITEEVMAEKGATALQYGPVEGHPGLMRVVGDIMERRGGRRPAPDELLIANGSSNALSLIAELLLDPGDVVVCDRPTFANVIWLARARQAELVEVPIDEHGTDMDRLEQTLRRLAAQGKRVKYIYALPNFHNPAGVTMSMDRRRRLLELAAEHGVPILEDDAYNELSYDGDALPTLYSMDRAGMVVHAATFSKLLAPGVRLGWAAASRALIPRMIAFKHDQGTNPFASEIVATYCQRHLRERIPELRDGYRKKRDVMVQALEEVLPDDARWTKPAGGFFLWIELPARIDGNRLFRLALEERVAYLQGDMFCAGGNGQQFIRLSFSFNQPERTAEGIRRLGRALDRALSSAT